MDKMEKKLMMDKMLRELEDITNSQTSVLKKVAQLEAENFNLDNSLLGKRLPDIHEKVDASLTEVQTLQTDFTLERDAFVKEHKLDVVAQES